MTNKKEGVLTLSIDWSGSESGLDSRCQKVSGPRVDQLLRVLDQKADGQLSVVDAAWMAQMRKEYLEYGQLIQGLSGANLQLLTFIGQCIPALEAEVDRGAADPHMANTLLNTARELMKIETAGVSLATGQPTPIIKPSKPPTTH